MSPSTDELLARATTGDALAIEGLMLRLLPGLRGYLANRAGEPLRKHEPISDLAQSVCREVLAHLRDGRLRFRGEAEFKQWFYRAAALKLSDRQRSWGRVRGDVLPANQGSEGAAEVRWGAGAEPTPSEDAVLREEAERFRRAFEELEPEQREVIALFHVEGLTHAEIAARLQISEVNSRQRLARALAELAHLGAKTFP